LVFEHDNFGALIKKQVKFNFSKVSLRLDLCESLFSSFTVDLGTQALLNSLRKNEAIDYSRILDLGCGYGPIGLFLKAQEPSRKVHMVDRDALAVDFALHNASLNRLDVSVYPSLDYENVEGSFSLIVTNFPAKMAIRGLQIFVHGASNHLSNNGVLAVVVVCELAEKLDQILDNRMIRVLYREDKKEYCVRHVAFNEKVPQPIGKYERQKMKLKLTKSYTVKTAFGLPEFDNLSFGTQCMLSVLKGMKGYNSVFVLEPGQGHSAIAVMDMLKPKDMLLASRDLLSLYFSKQNVASNFGFEPRTMHVSCLKEPPEQKLTVWGVLKKKYFAVDAYNLKILLKSDKPFLIFGERGVIRTLMRKEPVIVLKEAVQKNYCSKLLKLKK
jgi:16S rRNA (guanine1207-N2)-methyltransferase